MKPQLTVPVVSQVFYFWGAGIIFWQWQPGCRLLHDRLTYPSFKRIFSFIVNPDQQQNDKNHAG